MAEQDTPDRDAYTDTGDSSSPEQVIRTRAELAAAMAQRFFDNANTGGNRANDALVVELGAWQARHSGRQP